MALRWLAWMTAAALALPGGVAAAQTLEEEQEEAEAPPAEYGGDEGASGRLDDEQAEAQHGGDEPEPVRDSTDPFEEANQDYFFLGAVYRHVIIPGFIQQLFVDGGIDGSNPAVGLTFNWRKNNFNVSANLWWNNAEADGYFRALGDPRTDTEFIQARMGVIFVTAEFMWSFPITDWFAFELGFDLGFGFIYGGLTRTEAYETPGEGNFQPCTGPGQAGTNGYCEAPAAPDPCFDNPGGHYNCTEPNWLTRGGDVPVIFPWVSLPHLAVRFKPIHQLQIRVDGGYGLYSFVFGGSVAYGF